MSVPIDFEEAVLACHGLHDRDLGLPTSVCFLDTDDDGMFDHAMFGRTSGREREPYSVRDFTGYEEIEPVPYTASPAFEVRPSENVWQLDRVRTRRNGAVEIYFRSGSGIDGERYRLTDGGVFIRHNTVGEAFLYRDDHVRIELNEFPVTLDFMTYQVIINGVNDDNSVAIEFHMRADGG